MEAAPASLKGQMAALDLLNRMMWKKQLQKLPVMHFFYHNMFCCLNGAVNF